MNNKVMTVSIIGLGARGKETYGRFASKTDSGLQIVALCDTNFDKLELAKLEFNVPSNMCFIDTDTFFRMGKLSDILIISNFDQDHYEAAIKAIDLGYNILLEKPVSNKLLECLKIRDYAKLKKVNITVCHVMRYTSYYMFLKKQLDAKLIGDIVGLEQTEDVGYWHMAHAFVRGNFRNSATTSPMILQKCCHDMDLIVYLMGKKPESISSFGDLYYFKEANAPQGSTDYCYSCKVKKCPFNAYDFYVNLYKERKKTNTTDSWPLSQVLEKPTESGLIQELQHSRFGRCVFRCDNNVVDHQFSMIKFTDSTVATLTMIGFSNNGGRSTHVYGTKGEIYLDEQRRTIEISLFGHEKKIVSFDELTDDFSGHGGGDNEMMKEFVEKSYKCLNRLGDNEMLSSIEKSVESHVLCFAAEESRKNNGKVINVDEFEKKEKME